MFFKNSRNSCRERSSHLQSLSTNHILWTLSLIFRAVLIILVPAGCSSIINTELDAPTKSSQTSLHQNSQLTGKTWLDILTFDDDRLARLDAYQTISDYNEDIAYVESTGGKKIIFFCTTGPHHKYEWKGINSYSALNQMLSYLKHESRDLLTKTGECRTTAGDKFASVILKPLVCKIQIEAFSYDFSGTPYSKSQITELKAYLINVNSSCPLIYTYPEKPIQIINHGRLSTEDLKCMTDPSLLYSEINDIQRKAAVFFCMPNYGIEGNHGNPPTRLVLEGRIDGHTYYWPINIGTQVEDGTYIVERNHCYAYDIHIRRKGTTDPDIPISIDTCEIDLNIKSWIEKKEYGIEF